MKLHEAIISVLRANENTPLSVTEITNAINSQGLYSKKDGTKPTSNQISARISNRAYSKLFCKSDNKPVKIFLRAPGDL